MLSLVLRIDGECLGEQYNLGKAYFIKIIKRLGVEEKKVKQSKSDDIVDT